ncbi:hypothetical protein U6G28_05110 [Actinomycetaceae bacterium MB13-C1-2]|nr:hypothetical protein U6G28_05110 [Actinomycetaceae bacterium MB13-C1-2]
MNAGPNGWLVATALHLSSLWGDDFEDFLKQVVAGAIPVLAWE